MKDSGFCIIFPSFLPVSWHTEACDDNTARLAQQHLEAGLLEVVIAGEGLLDAVLSHHDEGRAICKRPLLVGALGVQSAALTEQSAAGGDTEESGG